MPNLTTQQTIKVKVNQQDGSLVPQNKMPVVLKNTVQESVGIGGLGNVNEGTPSSGGTLVYNANTDLYDVRPLRLTDLGDIVGSPANGDVIIFNGATNTFFYGTRPQSLAQLVDVDTTPRNNGDVLVYNSGTNTYVHAAVVTNGSSGNVSSLTVNNTVTIVSISDFANSTHLGSSAGANNELVTARAIKDYVDNVVGGSGGGGGGGGGASNLNGLLDVYINSGGLVNQQVLMYDSGRGEWVNRSIKGAADNIWIRPDSNNDLVIALTNNVVIANSLVVPTANVGNLTVTNTVTVSNNATVGGSLAVGQQLTVARTAAFANNVSVGGNATVNGQLSVTGNSTFSSTLTIQANASVSQQLTANNVRVGGALVTSGPVTIGNTSTTLVVDARLGSDIIPAANNEYSLGSPDKRFKDVYVSSGTLYLGEVVVSAADGTFTVSTDAVVQGEATYNANVNINAGINVQDTAAFNGNVSLGNTASDQINFNGVVATDIIPAANTTQNLGSSTKRFQSVNSNTVNATTGNFSGNVVIGGNLTVEGDFTQLDVATVRVEDPLIQLSSNNTSDVVDIGFFGTYFDGTINRYSGLFRDASDAGKYVLFANLHSTALPTTTVNRTSPSFQLSTLVSYLESGGLVSSPTTISLTANSTLSVGISANTLSLTTPLGAASGGLGRSTLTPNALLVGNGTNAVKQITATQAQQVLSVVGGIPTFVSSLDAGEY